MGKSIKTKSRLVVSRGWGREAEVTAGGRDFFRER